MNLNNLLQGIRITTAGILLSCAGPTLATRPYTTGNRQENAYLNMRDILKEICPEFTISSSGFRCMQHYMAQGWVASDYRWSEIKRVECLGKDIHVTGEYDSSDIYTFGLTWETVNPQCQELADAMNIYLRERKK